ncbi:Hypothetical predicted protein [Paramuricea clavata]|uniref:Uncharacterized protein n=1 Tax=Paramuricea clavata TaxID=317549 RepID=A0A6S7L9L3_PARCT|nr:Hypothetical predicted protein [Paramuricea clavata]
MINPDKFQFAQRSVDFAGFRVSSSTIEPLPKYLDAIRDFPSPTSTTDIRSWFGLVNQVTNYAQLRDVMAPFKPLVSPRCKFHWSPELEDAFTTSKEAIVEAIRKGVQIFDIHKQTCLRPDWSRRGIGYFLLQQHCSCPSGIPECCPGGWHITLAGSRFLSSAEERYAAIEGEALAVAWGLEQTRYFTQEHLPGKTNLAADATSRHPSPSGSVNTASLVLSSCPDFVEAALMASIRHDAQELGTISWPPVAQKPRRTHT